MDRLKILLDSRTIRLALIQAVVGIAIAIATEYDAIGAIVIIKSVGDILLRMDTVGRV